MKRIAVIGSPGTGKSTFATRLGEVSGLPVFHLDKEFWLPGWTEPDKTEFRARVAEICDMPEWIIDGNYSSTYHLRLPAADTIILLEASRWICMWRAVKRVLQSYGRTRPDMAEGCPERFDLEFMRYIWTFPERNGEKIEKALAEAEQGDKQVLRVSGDREREELLTRLGQLGAQHDEIKQDEVVVG